jgi:hypothetical protein
LAKRCAVAPSCGFAEYRFGSMGKAIESERGEDQKLVQDLVGGERDVTEPRAFRHEETQNGDYTERSQHEVAIDREHTDQLVAIEEACARTIVGQRAQCSAHVARACHQSRVFGHQRRQCDAGHTPLQSEHE